MTDSSVPNDLRARNTRTNKLEVVGGDLKLDGNLILDKAATVTTSGITATLNGTKVGVVTFTGAGAVPDIPAGGIQAFVINCDVAGSIGTASIITQFGVAGGSIFVVQSVLFTPGSSITITVFNNGPSTSSTSYILTFSFQSYN